MITSVGEGHVGRWGWRVRCAERAPGGDVWLVFVRGLMSVMIMANDDDEELVRRCASKMTAHMRWRIIRLSDGTWTRIREVF